MCSSSNIRGFNFIEDFAYYTDGPIENLSQDEILHTIFVMNNRTLQYKNSFDNREEEMKRFIAWFYSVYEDIYDTVVSSDTTGFLKECIDLYDPKVGAIPPPMHCKDYSSKF